jgi:N-acetyl-anhydromuramyl-L-alanine amidase AmpD
LKSFLEHRNELIEKLESELKKCEIEHVHVELVESFKTPHHSQHGKKIDFSPENKQDKHEHSHIKEDEKTEDSSHFKLKEDLLKTSFEEKFKDI